MADRVLAQSPGSSAAAPAVSHPRLSASGRTPWQPRQGDGKALAPDWFRKCWQWPEAVPQAPAGIHARAGVERGTATRHRPGPGLCLERQDVRPAGAAATPRPVGALPDKPSIAVLPFQNLSGDPEQEYFADGTVEDIVTALSRFRNLFVSSRNSSFTYKGHPVALKHVCHYLAAPYVL